MRIREVFFKDFRSFRGERKISFVDPLTDAVRPVSVLAGTNGTGKTTVFDTIEALLTFALEPDAPRDLINEAWATGLVGMAIELSPYELGQAQKQPGFFDDNTNTVVHIVAGKRDLVGSPEKEWPNLFCRLVQRGVSGHPYVRKTPLIEKLRKSVSLMQQDKAELYGGLLYFPHNRQLKVSRGGTIEPPPEERPWRFHFSPADRWQGSLEQLWVWHNYLDLEQGIFERRNLQPFVEAVESVLGEGRSITVKEGRALVAPSWSSRERESEFVRLDQLPSGEQQCLLLFGELARRRRYGAVITIDEIENSLHPTLQRMVVHRMRQFARQWDSQLILATHSLEVLRAVHESERIILDQLDEMVEPAGEAL